MPVKREKFRETRKMVSVSQPSLVWDLFWEKAPQWENFSEYIRRIVREHIRESSFSLENHKALVKEARVHLAVLSYFSKPEKSEIEYKTVCYKREDYKTIEELCEKNATTFINEVFLVSSIEANSDYREDTIAHLRAIKALLEN